MVSKHRYTNNNSGLATPVHSNSGLDSNNGLAHSCSRHVTPLHPPPLRSSDYYQLHPHRAQRLTLRSKTMTTTNGNTTPQATATMLLLHSSLRGIHHVAMAILMTVAVLKQWPIGPLQSKTTGTTKRDALTTTEQEEGNENGQALMQACYWPGIQPYQCSFDSAIPRTMRHSAPFHGSEACGFHVDTLSSTYSIT